MIAWLVLTFFAVVATGPAVTDPIRARRERRQAEADRPVARVAYLPSAACRPRVVD
jgi:hypothetical protein